MGKIENFFVLESNNIFYVNKFIIFFLFSYKCFRRFNLCILKFLSSESSDF